MPVWVKQRRSYRPMEREGLKPGRYWVNHPWLCALSLLLCVLLSSCAFFLPTSLLPLLGIICAVLLIQGVLLGGKVKGLFILFCSQLTITLLLYLLLHGGERINEGILAVVRILLAMIPGWWLSISCSPHRIGQVLSWCLPHQWAFVLAACFSLLPHLSQEVREIYQMQVMRGARITPKALINPKNWRELVYCVLYPLLIQLLKLSKQMAVAAKLRGFGQTNRPTHWPE
ncbi:energy-coupling factor transporter transmembrane protein EcfT [Shewanella sp. AS1]|uniref:energy-coupling factor transporter transmembrane component T n=1 Tax=Shewanella sp. AS1 TaxID=2907626 RepID=UPI001F3BA273|nr:energy-coupling factor transporter transmembrane component T [Shewanella sp. AS1]MCE9680407.1 energy-coupling factor transporter transmembrane protein EcfT [Shewanella sp. AS1]